MSRDAKKSIYFDHNATTPVEPAVLEEMLPFFSGVYGNPSSVHRFGQEALLALDSARDRVAGFIGAEPEEIIFTSGGTESVNHAIRGVAEVREEKGKHIIASAVEHQAVLNCCRYLETRGFNVSYLPVDKYGVVAPETVASAVTDETILITVMLANNDVGTLEPVREIAEIASAKEIPMHTDAVQAAGKIPIDVEALGVDLLSLSGHKLYGPKGVGALYVRRGLKLAPIIHGGHHETRRRAGTENMPGIVGFGKACEIGGDRLIHAAQRLASLRDRLQEGILGRLKQVRLNGHPEHRLPNTLNLSFAHIEGEALMMNLDLMGIAVSTGSACSSGTQDPSHVLVAMGLANEESNSSIRFSLGWENTEEEVDEAVDSLCELVGRLREASPLYGDAEREGK